MKRLDLNQMKTVTGGTDTTTPVVPEDETTKKVVKFKAGSDLAGSVQ